MQTPAPPGLTTGPPTHRLTSSTHIQILLWNIFRTLLNYSQDTFCRIFNISHPTKFTLTKFFGIFFKVEQHGLPFESAHTRKRVK
jgi:hypothetical protein